MPELDLRRFRPQIIRLTAPIEVEPQWRRCAYAKYLYLLKDGIKKTVSAKIRWWTKPRRSRFEEAVENRPSDAAFSFPSTSPFFCTFAARIYGFSHG